MKKFGCVNCWPSDTHKVYEAVTSLPVEFYLIDRTILTVDILACPCCYQRFLQITEDIVNWCDGHDAIFRKFMPINDKELARLTKSSTLDLRTIHSLGKERASLNYDCFDGYGPELYWSTGFGHIRYEWYQSNTVDLLSYDFSI